MSSWDVDRLAAAAGCHKSSSSAPGSKGDPPGEVGHSPDSKLIFIEDALFRIYSSTICIFNVYYINNKREIIYDVSVCVLIGIRSAMHKLELPFINVIRYYSYII